MHFRFGKPRGVLVISYTTKNRQRNDRAADSVRRDTVLLSCGSRLRFRLCEFRAIERRVVLHFDDADGHTGGRFKPRASGIHGYQIGKPNAASRVSVIVIIHLKWRITHGRG